MAPTLYCVRHAQGFHNVPPPNPYLKDPLLTDLGKDQCRKLSVEFPHSDKIDLIVVSPLRRTISTALHSFEKPIKERKVKIIALPELQEAHDLPCDTGSSREDLEKEFAGYGIDFSLVDESFAIKKGKYAPVATQILNRAREARLWLRNRSEKHVAVVSHGAFLHYFTEDWAHIPDLSHATGWVNTEWRAYDFLPGESTDASLAEIPESRSPRKGHEHPLSEAEQRELMGVAIATWEDLGYIKKAESVEADTRQPQPSVV